MADQDQTPTEATEVSADISETELDGVVGGFPLGDIKGESKDTGPRLASNIGA